MSDCQNGVCHHPLCQARALIALVYHMKNVVGAPEPAWTPLLEKARELALGVVPTTSGLPEHVPDRGWLTLPEVAIRLGVSRQAVAQAINRCQAGHRYRGMTLRIQETPDRGLLVHAASLPSARRHRGVGDPAPSAVKCGVWMSLKEVAASFGMTEAGAGLATQRSARSGQSWRGYHVERKWVPRFGCGPKLAVQVRLTPVKSETKGETQSSQTPYETNPPPQG